MKYGKEYLEWERKEVSFGSVLEVDGFKIGPQEASSQNCLVSLYGMHGETVDIFVRRFFVEMLFEENKKLKAQLKIATDTLGKNKEEILWAKDTVSNKLKFGLPEEQAIKRRESRCCGVFISALGNIQDAFKKIKEAE